MSWDSKFLKLFRHGLSLYQEGNHDFMSYYDAEDLSFLTSIGYKPRELFDFVEDFADGGDPTESAALLIAAVRRDYLGAIQHGVLSDREIGRNDVPSFDDQLNSIPYLPRIIAKAQAKLRGELDPDMMYGCGADRRFLRENGDIHPADFLRQVWAAGDDLEKVANFVKDSTAS